MLKESKLTELLSALSYKEMKRFGVFLRSPFFNTNQRSIEVYNWIKGFHPTFDHKEYTPEFLYIAIYGLQPFDLAKVRYALTDLTRLVEEYLTYLEFEKQGARKKHLLLQNLESRSQDKYFKQHLRSAQDLQEKATQRDTKWFHNQLLLEEDAYNFSSTRDNRAIDTRLQNLSDNIDKHFLSLKLKTSCEIINRMNVLNVNYDTSFLDKVIEYLEEHPYEDTPAIHIYHQVLRTLKTPDEPEHYFVLKDMLVEHLNLFSQSEMRDMYAYVQNYCIRRINTGHTEFMQELFEAYQNLLSSRIIYQNDELSQFDFKNIVTVALRAEAYDWAETFIENEHLSLRDEFRNNAYTYNLARLHYYKEEFRQALRLLLSVEFTDVYYHLDSKSLLLKTYYELDDFEPLLSLITTFKAYLRRNKLISDYQRDIYTNLLIFVKKLTRLKLGRNVTLESIKAGIEETPQIADLNWLNQKVEALEA